MVEGSPRVGLIVGRFQPVHWGHVRLIEWIRADGAVPLVGLGSSQFSHTRENPFTASERRRMIQAADQALGLKVGSVEEVPDIFDDTRWVQHVEGCVGHFDVVYSNNEWTSGLFTAAGYEVRPAPLFERDRLEGAKIRLLIKDRGLDAVSEAIPEVVMAILRELDAEKRIRGSWSKETPPAR
jgi:nicotinamide-nucleotide adenylyltransferase